MEKDTVVLLGCGDVGSTDEPMESYSTLVRPVLAAGDIRFGQCERVYSERGSRHVHGSAHSRVKASRASVFSDCGFDVVSLASNHGLDWGEDALVDTIELFQKKGIYTIGAGRDLREARRPAILERNGVRIAFLGYCSVLRQGYAAQHDSAGIAPLRAHTDYEPLDFNPGVPPRVVTVPHAEDLEAVVTDITAAKKLAHVVVLSLHWGVHFFPRIVAEYQPIITRAAIDAGADLILGHHPHIPKAIEVYNGKVCFYSLGNFIMTLRSTPESAAAFSRKYGIEMHPLLAYGPDCHRTLVAKAVLSREGVKKVSFLPALIDKQLRPEILRRDDARFDEMVGYLEWASEGFNHKFAVEGDEVLVTN